MSDHTGRFVWYELMTRDAKAAIPFYEKVIGWGAHPWPGPTPYTVWMNGEAPIGGVMDLPEEAAAAGAPPHWMPYISTADVDATAARAVELGGTIVAPGMDLPEVGRIAVLSDPQGAVFTIFKPANPMEPSSGAPEPGQFSWHELATDDYEAAFAFYSELFGWEKTTAMDMGEGNMYQMYGVPGKELGGIYNRPPEMPVSCWLLYTSVADVNAAVEAVKSGGGQVLNGPMEVPGGDMVAMCVDPQGAAFALHSRAS